MIVKIVKFSWNYLLLKIKENRFYFRLKRARPKQSSPKDFFIESGNYKLINLIPCH